MRRPWHFAMPFASSRLAPSLVIAAALGGVRDRDGPFRFCSISANFSSFSVPNQDSLRRRQAKRDVEFVQKSLEASIFPIDDCSDRSKLRTPASLSITM